MKLKKFLAMTMAAVMTIGFATSCGDDDDDSDDLAGRVTGNYTGYAIGGGSLAGTLFDAQKVVVKRHNGDKDAVDVTYTASNGVYTINEATVSKSGDNHLIVGTGTFAASGSLTSATQTATLSASVTTSSDYTFRFSSNGQSYEFHSGATPYATLIAGTYAGTTVANGTGIDKNYTADDETATLTIAANAADASKADITLVSKSWGTFTYDDCKVTFANGKFSVSGSGTTTMMNGSVGRSYNTTLKAVVENGKITSFEISVPDNGKFTLKFTPAN